MSAGSEHGSEPGAPGGGGQGGIRWDLSGARSSYCTVTSAGSAPQKVIVNFGIPRGRDGSPRELEVELLHRVVLSPMAASRLRELVARLLAEHEAH